MLIQGEPTRLRQVFHNLLQNAVDAQADVAEPRFEIALASDGHEARAARSPTTGRASPRT